MWVTSRLFTALVTVLSAGSGCSAIFFWFVAPSRRGCRTILDAVFLVCGLVVALVPAYDEGRYGASVFWVVVGF